MSMDNKGGLEGFQESSESLREAASQIFKTKHLMAAGVLGSLAAATEPLWSPHFHKTMNIIVTTSLLLGACAPGVVPRPTPEVGSTPDSVATEEGIGISEAFTKDEALKAMEVWRTFSNGVQNGQLTGPPECVPTSPGSEVLLTFNPQKPSGEIDKTISYGFCTAPVSISGGEAGEVNQGSAFFLKHDSVANTTEAYILIKATETDYQVGGLRDGRTYRESFDLRYSPGPNGEDQFSIVKLDSAGEELLDVEGMPTAASETYDVVFKTNGSGLIDLTPTAPGANFENGDLSQQLGYSLDVLKGEGYVGVERGDGLIADLTYTGLLGIRADGSKELVGIQFKDVFVKISAKDVLDLSTQLDKPFNFADARVGDFSVWNVNAISTGIVENIAVKDPTGVQVGEAQAQLVVVEDEKAKPRLVWAPIQIETADNPNVNMALWLAESYLGGRAQKDKLFSTEELEQLIPKGSVFVFSLPKKGSSGSDLQTFFNAYSYSNPSSNLSDFLDSRGTRVSTQDPPLLFTIGVQR